MYYRGRRVRSRILVIIAIEKSYKSGAVPPSLPEAIFSSLFLNIFTCNLYNYVINFNVSIRHTSIICKRFCLSITYKIFPILIETGDENHFEMHMLDLEIYLFENTCFVQGTPPPLILTTCLVN